MAPNKAGHKGGAPGQRLKVVVRKLPPDLPPKVFWQTTAQWITREDSDAEGVPGAERVAWSQYRQGKVRKRCAHPSLLVPVITRLTLLTLARSGKDKDSVNSRAYITFKTPEALVAFHKGYEGWAFRDKSGACRPSLVHSSTCSPYQAADC
jgi:regulator of nonsense transcripts 3